PPISTLFPYTTLFRSSRRLPRRSSRYPLSQLVLGLLMEDRDPAEARRRIDRARRAWRVRSDFTTFLTKARYDLTLARTRPPPGRSEEHTSELQSPDHL